MKVYKNQNGDTFAYEADGSQDHLISADLIPISEEEEKYLNDIKEKQRFASNILKAITWLEKECTETQGVKIVHGALQLRY